MGGRAGPSSACRSGRQGGNDHPRFHAQGGQGGSEFAGKPSLDLPEPVRTAPQLPFFRFSTTFSGRGDAKGEVTASGGVNCHRSSGARGPSALLHLLVESSERSMETVVPLPNWNEHTVPSADLSQNLIFSGPQRGASAGFTCLGGTIAHTQRCEGDGEDCFTHGITPVVKGGMPRVYGGCPRWKTYLVENGGGCQRLARLFSLDARGKALRRAGSLYNCNQLR